ncbi:hypothetical protein [Nostoc commune]|nr:hypothetical protein [Nostoc commune]
MCKLQDYQLTHHICQLIRLNVKQKVSDRTKPYYDSLALEKISVIF